MFYTSYWAKAQWLHAHHIQCVSISLSVPAFARPYVQGELKCFMPTWDILNRYKHNDDMLEYEEDYIELLNTRKHVIEKIVQRMRDVYYKDVALCCWEKPGVFCHRQLVSKYLAENFSLYLPEY